MNYGEALELLKEGKTVTRYGWNGKGMFIFMRPEDRLPAEVFQKAVSIPQPVKDFYSNKFGRDFPGSVRVTAYLCMKAADDTIVNGWLASQTDMLAEDWQEFEI